MRWFWIVIGILLALAAGFIVWPNFVKVKYGPMAPKVTRYCCVPAGSPSGSDEFTFTVQVWGIPDPEAVAIRVEGEFSLVEGSQSPSLLQTGRVPDPIELRDDGLPPDVKAGDWDWTGTGKVQGLRIATKEGIGYVAKSVCVVIRQGKKEYICPVPPLEVKP